MAAVGALGAGLLSAGAWAGATVPATTAPATYAMEATAAPALVAGGADEAAGSWQVSMAGTTAQGWTSGDAVEIVVADPTGANCSGDAFVGFTESFPPSVSVTSTGFGAVAPPTVTASLAYLTPCGSSVANVLLITFTNSGTFPSASAAATLTVTGVAYTLGSAVPAGALTVGASLIDLVGTVLSGFAPPSTATPPASGPAFGDPSDAVATAAPPPTVSSVAPAGGPPGTMVTVTGAGFGSDQWVVPCTPSPGVCPCAALAAGTCPCTQMTIFGCACVYGSTCPASAGAPTLQFVPDVSAVRFGSVTVPASSVAVVSPTELQVPAPPGAAGPVDVTVVTATGTSTVSPGDVFTALPPPPAVTSIFPGQGPARGYTVVFVFGTGLGPVSGVTLGGRRVLWRSFSSTLVLVLAPPALVAGAVDVQVTTPSGTSPATAADRFTYLPAPTA